MWFAANADPVLPGRWDVGNHQHCRVDSQMGHVHLCEVQRAHGLIQWHLVDAVGEPQWQRVDAIRRRRKLQAIPIELQPDKAKAPYQLEKQWLGCDCQRNYLPTVQLPRHATQQSFDAPNRGIHAHV